MATTVWKGHLTFGLVSIPVRLYRAARKETVRMRYVHESHESEPDEPEPASATHSIPEIQPSAPRAIAEVTPPVQISHVRQELVNTETEKRVARNELARAYEYAPEQYAVVSQQELRRLRVPTSRTLEITQTARLSEIDPVYFETSYYVAPDRGGEPAYNLFYSALRDAGYVALARIAMHGREHVIIVRSGPAGLLAHTMYYEDEIRAESEFRADPTAVKPKELAMARSFIEALAAPFDPRQFQDSYRARLQEVISGKVSEHKPKSLARRAAPVVDIMDALKASLSQAKKPVQSAEPPKAVNKRRVRKA